MMKHTTPVKANYQPLLTSWIILLFIVTLGCSKGSLADETVCNTIDIRNKVENFDQLENCTVIEGNLKIILIDFATSSEYEDLSFPGLVEITGYFLMFRVKGLLTFKHIFPNLAVIRGQQLFFNYALVAFEMQDMKEIGLHGLVTIQRGGVRIEKNSNLCYMDTINFQVLVGGTQTENFMRDNKEQSQCPNVCPKDRCRLFTGVQYEILCWTSSHCQIVCPQACQDNCRNGKCTCSGECVGGCHGVGTDKCVACRNYVYSGHCVEECPPGTYAYRNRRCITRDECPKEWKLFDNQCLEDCPNGYTSNSTHPILCQPCDGPCPKVCGGVTVDSVGRAEELHGCTIIDGDLRIIVHGGTNIVAELENNLNLIEEVTGFVEVSHTYSLVSFTFLKNLKRIRGNTKFNGIYSLYVLDNQNLQHLFELDHQHKNLTIDGGKIFFHFNPKLCMRVIRELEEHIALTEEMDENDISKTTNGDQVPCETKTIVLGSKPYKNHIMLVWSISDELGDPRDLLSYQLSWREAPERNVTEFDGQDACGSPFWHRQDNPAHSRNTAITNLQPWTQYAIYIKTYTIAGSLKGAKSDIIYVTTLQDKPTTPVNLKAVSKSPSELMLTWEPPSKPNGNITKYEVRIWQTKEDKEDFNLRDYCIEVLSLPSHERETTRQEDIDNGNGNFTGACCACPKDEKQLKIEQDEALFRKEFENFIHNNVYEARPVNDNYFERPRRNSQSKRSTPSHFAESVTTRREPMDDSYNPQDNVTYTIETHTEAPSMSTQDTNITTEATPTTENSYSEAVVFLKTEYLLDGLNHFTEYYIEVSACNEDCGYAAVANARTLPNASADDIPGNITISHIEREVHIKWQDPPSPNGLIVSYYIAYIKLNDLDTEDLSRREARSESMINDLQEYENGKEECISYSEYQVIGGYILKDLSPGNYSMRVRASSLAGNGTWTWPVFFVKSDLPADQSEHHSQPKYGNTIIIVVGCVVGVVAIIIAICVAVVYKVKRSYMNNGIPKGVLYASYNPEYMSAADVYIPDEWEVPRDKVSLVRELGQGSFGMVYEGEAKDLKDEEGKVKVAVKTVNENACIRDRIEFLNEASVMKAFNCSHVVRLLGVVSKGQPTLVLMELMVQGDLKNWLRSHRPDELDNKNSLPPTVTQILHMAGEIADGMAYLAAQKFVHRDLAARNCMVAEDGSVKIGDFGMTRDIYETDYYRKGGKGLLPVRWMAPESLKDGVFTSQSDVWSYGVVLWEMATLAEQPYQGLSNEQVLKYVIDGNCLDEPTGCPERLFSLMKLCWRYNPKMRPSFIDLIENLEAHCELSPHFKEVSFYHSEERRVNKDSHKQEEAMPLLVSNTEDDFENRNTETEASLSTPTVEVRPASARSGSVPIDYAHVPKNGALNGTVVKVPKCTTC
ncbi:insulin-like peptide receptor [Glandiceps talaboti]